LKAEPELATKNQRVAHRPRLLKAIGGPIALRSVEDGTGHEESRLAFAR
jgi:hypothetical protein